MAAAVKALCSALSEINSAIHLLHSNILAIISNLKMKKKKRQRTYAIVNGTAVPPIVEVI
jgi:hypothetical protein